MNPDGSCAGEWEGGKENNASRGRSKRAKRELRKHSHCQAQFGYGNQRTISVHTMGNKYKSNTARIVIYLRKLLLRTIVSLNHRMPLVLLIPFKPFSGAGLPCSRFGF